MTWCVADRAQWRWCCPIVDPPSAAAIQCGQGRATELLLHAGDLGLLLSEAEQQGEGGPASPVQAAVAAVHQAWQEGEGAGRGVPIFQRAPKASTDSSAAAGAVFVLTPLCFVKSYGFIVVSSRSCRRTGIWLANI